MRRKLIYYKHGMAATVKKFSPSLTRAQQKIKKPNLQVVEARRQYSSGREQQLKNSVGQSHVLEDDEEEEIARWVTDLLAKGCK
ncbi:hypothetical protein PHMEG_00014859 [Phytophthora megakarya]|uniref:Uncharacterized protein n=1 Tax=Phytophthora megakarya TaxID=4795 RepID=A0A225W4T1_9STRA|nr:hypothetical protein PHMEG_00014859 [Phytophthora megakarya]